MSIKSIIVGSAITCILSTFSMATLGETFEQCVESKKAELSSQIQSFAVENIARCYSCKLCWLGEKPEERSAQVVYNAPPNYNIVGDVQSISTSANGHGWVSPVNYEKDENGHVKKVYVNLTCRSANSPFGAGAWQQRRITGNIQKIGITAEDVLSITQACTK